MPKARNKRTRDGFHQMRMNDQVYALRRKVIDIIYQANDKLRGAGLPKMPRQTIRIVDSKECTNVAGYAWMGQDIVHIKQDTCRRDDLLHVVLHELCHSVLGVRHDEECPLMASCLPYCAVSEDKLWDTFIDYFRK